MLRLPVEKKFLSRTKLRGRKKRLSLTMLLLCNENWMEQWSLCFVLIPRLKGAPHFFGQFHLGQKRKGDLVHSIEKEFCLSVLLRRVCSRHKCHRVEDLSHRLLHEAALLYVQTSPFP